MAGFCNPPMIPSQAVVDGLGGLAVVMRAVQQGNKIL